MFGHLVDDYAVFLIDRSDVVTDGYHPRTNKEDLLRMKTGLLLKIPRHTWENRLPPGLATLKPLLITNFPIRLKDIPAGERPNTLTYWNGALNAYNYSMM